MAYLDLASRFVPEDLSAGAAPGTATPPARMPAPRFTPLEWSVVALASQDRLSSLGEPGRMARALGGLFGLGSASRLADPRLEALRRMAVQAWHHGYLLPVSEIGRFIEAGFTMDQFEALLLRVSGWRSDRRRPRGKRRPGMA